MPDEHVELAEAEAAQDLDPLERVDLAVQVPHPDAELDQVVGEVLRHLLRERGDQHPLVGLGPQVDLGDEVVDLALGGLHDDLGVDEARSAARSARRPGSRCSSSYALGRRRHEDELVHLLDELLEAQRPVVHRRRQPEAVLDQRLLARLVALELAVQLRHRRRATRRARRGSRRGSSRAGCRAAAPARRPSRWRE